VIDWNKSVYDIKRNNMWSSHIEHFLEQDNVVDTPYSHSKYKEIEKKFDDWFEKQGQKEQYGYLDDMNKLKVDFQRYLMLHWEMVLVTLNNIQNTIFFKNSNDVDEMGVMTDGVNPKRIDQILLPGCKGGLLLDYGGMRSANLKNKISGLWITMDRPVAIIWKEGTYVYADNMNQRALVYKWVKVVVNDPLTFVQAKELWPVYAELDNLKQDIVWLKRKETINVWNSDRNYQKLGAWKDNILKQFKFKLDNNSYFWDNNFRTYLNFLEDFFWLDKDFLFHLMTIESNWKRTVNSNAGSLWLFQFDGKHLDLEEKSLGVAYDPIFAALKVAVECQKWSKYNPSWQWNAVTVVAAYNYWQNWLKELLGNASISKENFPKIKKPETQKHIGKYLLLTNEPENNKLFNTLGLNSKIEQGIRSRANEWSK